MVRNGSRLPSFCLNRIATRVRVRSPPAEPKPAPGASETDLFDPKCSGNAEKDNSGEEGKKEAAVGRRIMIVVDSSNESKGALQWALSHTVQSQDTVVLLSVTKPSSRINGECECQKQMVDKRSNQLLRSMKNICQAKKPGVEVEVCMVEGRERGHVIVEEARKQDASLLVLGQKKRSVTWRLVMMWAAGVRINGGGSGGVVDYCIQNSSCMTVAVRRKSRKGGGGYLITTRRHKDFWLLA